MFNLTELKNALQNSEELTDLSSLEQVVFSYLQGNLESKIIVKTLSASEIDLGLNNYLDNSTMDLWLSAVNLQNLNLFLKLNNLEINTQLKNWIGIQSDLKIIKCQVNLETLNCKLEQNNLTGIFSQLNISVDCSEITEFVASLQLVEESANQYFAAQLIFINGGYKLVVGDGENQESERINWWQQNLVKPIQIATVCLALFAANGAKADDAQKDAAINAARGAIMSTEQGKEIKETVEQLQKKVTQAAEKIVKESGTEIPVTVVGYGVKAAMDKKVEIKKTSLQSIGLAMDANMAIGFDGSMNLGIGGKTPFLDNGNYKIQGATGGGANSIEMKLNFEF